MKYILEAEFINSIVFIIFIIYHLFCIGIFLGFVIEELKRDKEDVSVGKCFIITIIVIVTSPIASPILLGTYFGSKIGKNS